MGDAYKLGNLDAVLTYGLSKESGLGHLVLPGAAAATLAALAPEGEGSRAAVLGGAGGLALQSFMLGRGRPMSASLPTAATPTRSFADIGHAAWQQGKQDVQRWLTSATQPKVAAVDIGGGIPIPGLGGLSVNFKDQRERLPGMSHWIPRDSLERGFDNVDSGIDVDTAAQRESDRGSLLHPLVGAAMAAAGAARFAPKSGVGGALLSGLIGSGAGSVYHQATKDMRAREGREAYEAAGREREKFPIRRHAIQTANEASPLAVSRGSGDA